jgi:o-succinylbenzoate synthase
MGRKERVVATEGLVAGRARAVKVPIRIRRVKVHSVERPLVSKLGRAYQKIITHRSLLVRVEDEDGSVGWGEASSVELPAYAPDSHDSSWYALTKLLVPRAVGVEFDGPAALVDSWAELRGYHYARHALEAAAWAVASEKLARPLSQLWGGVRAEVAVGESFGVKETLDELQAEIEERLADGYCRIKLKIGPGWDVDVLRAVAARFPGIPLSADANCHYSSPFEGPWREMDELGLLMIEQPLAADALSELADLQSTLRTPICLDESAASPGITAAALRMGSGRVVNIKAARLGGLLASLEVHDLCQARSVPVWCGGILESGVGRGFNLALCSLPNFSLPADMSPAKIFFEEDLVDPTYDIRPDGTMAVPTGLGCGFPVLEDRIRHYTKAAWSSE